MSNDAATASANWTEFVDSISGIELYEYVLGSTSGSSDIIDWTDNGTSSSIIGHSGLNLQHTDWYYFSVRATDLAGNVSAVSTSDGFVIDIYPGPPTFVSMTFDTASELLSLTNDRVVDIVLSEPSVSMEYEMTSIFPVTHTSSLDNDSIQINLNAPFTSLDTLIFSISNLTDMIGLDSSYSFTIYTKLIADYNDDGLIDVNDLNAFSTAWNAEDITMELGPVTGIVPHLIPTLDNVYDLRDIMILARMWNWYHQTYTFTMTSLANVGGFLPIEQQDRSLIVTLPEGAVAGQVYIQYPSTSKNFATAANATTENRIYLSRNDDTKGEMLVEWADLSQDGMQMVSFDAQSLDRDNSNITIGYTIYGADQEIISRGMQNIEIIAIPGEYALHYNYPNPFNPATAMLYDLPETGHTRLLIYDLLGREVHVLIDKIMDPGYYSTQWNGRNSQGQTVGAGVYLYQIQSNGFIQTRKMLLLK